MFGCKEEECVVLLVDWHERDSTSWLMVDQLAQRVIASHEYGELFPREYAAVVITISAPLRGGDEVLGCRG